MNPAGTAKIWTLGNRHSRKRPLGRKSLARYGAMESARRERLASGEAHGECKAEPASAGSIYHEATNRRSGTFLPEAIRIPIQIVALQIGSIMRLLAIGLPFPDHSTLSRRACGLPVQDRPRSGAGELHLIVDSTGLKLRGAGEWLFEKHGASKRRSWRKLHIGSDADSDKIVAFDLTDKEIDDASHIGLLLEQLEAAPASFLADGAYDRSHVLDAALAKNSTVRFIVPPCEGAVLGSTARTAPTQRDLHIRSIKQHGRMNW